MAKPHISAAAANDRQRYATVSGERIRGENHHNGRGRREMHHPLDGTLSGAVRLVDVRHSPQDWHSRQSLG